MKIYNSYLDKIEDFKTIKDKQLNLYVCGPTVYNYIHIGNARPVVFFDTLRRFFESQGYMVKFVSNFTDVDDKIIQKAKEENVSEMVIANCYIDAFLSDLESLNCYTDYIKPRVTDYMQHIIDYIQLLIDKGYAYMVNGDVYFRVEKLEAYGRLSNRDISDLRTGARVEVNPDKESPLDFTLWKKTDEGINFESQFSKGRPGWHTECVAMIDDIFGGMIDIHGGGSDLKFPHHENEIAQSMALNNHQLANYWMHIGRLGIKDTKMSKSIGNVILVKDVIDKMPLRYFLLSTHYRSPLNYDDEGFLMYIKEYEKLSSTYKQLHRVLDLVEATDATIIDDGQVSGLVNDFNLALEDDFNTANAITALQNLLKMTNVSLRQKKPITEYQSLYLGLKYMMHILGLKVTTVKMTEEDRMMYREWEMARKNKDFSQADILRDKLLERGIL